MQSADVHRTKARWYCRIPGLPVSKSEVPDTSLRVPDNALQQYRTEQTGTEGPLVGSLLLCIIGPCPCEPPLPVRRAGQQAQHRARALSLTVTVLLPWPASAPAGERVPGEGACFAQALTA